MAIYSLLLLPLLLFGFPSWAMEEQVPLVVRGDLQFHLSQGKQAPVIITTTKKIIDASGSGHLRGLLIEAEKNSGMTTISLTRVENIEAFKKVIYILERIADEQERQNAHNQMEHDARAPKHQLERLMLEFRNCDEISALLLYAHRFSISSLSEAIAVNLETNQFKLPANDVQTVEPVVNLATTLSNVIQREDGALNTWNGRTLQWLVKHILIYSYFDNSYKKVYERLRKAFKDDDFMINALTPSAEVIDECTKAGAEMVAKMRADEAEQEAQKLNFEVNSQYVQKQLDKGNGAIFLRVKASLAKEIAEALKVKTRNAYEIEIYPAEDVPSDMCCCSSFSTLSDTNNCQNPEHTIAYLTSTFLNWLLPQLTQCITLGGCFRGFRDCQAGTALGDLCRAAMTDGRFGQAIYSCVYDGLTAMVNCCRGNGCQGPTKTLRLVRTQAIGIPAGKGLRNRGDQSDRSEEYKKE